MEVIVVLGIGAIVLVIVVVAVGNAIGGRRASGDELEAERGAHAEEGDRGTGGEPRRDRPAGPDAEPTDPGPGELHPPGQETGDGRDEPDAALPSEAAGKEDPGQDEERT